VTWERWGAPSPTGSKGDVVGTEPNQVSIPLGKFGFRSQPEGWVQGRCLGTPLWERGVPVLKGWKEKERRETRQAQQGLF